MEQVKFSDLPVSEYILRAVEEMGFEYTTPIQAQGIPVVMRGGDFIGQAQTGTGKTAAFLLPILHSLTVNPSEKIATLIIVPTRELAVQIDQQLEGFSYFTPISAIAVYGGRDGQSLDLEKKA